MCLDGPHAEIELFGDRAVRMTERDQAEDLDLAVRQVSGRTGGSRQLGRQARAERRVEIGASPARGADRLDELRPGRVLEHVAHERRRAAPHGQTPGRPAWSGPLSPYPARTRRSAGSPQGSSSPGMLRSRTSTRVVAAHIARRPRRRRPPRRQPRCPIPLRATSEDHCDDGMVVRQHDRDRHALAARSLALAARSFAVHRGDVNAQRSGARLNPEFLLCRRGVYGFVLAARPIAWPAVTDRLSALDATFLKLEEADDCAHAHRRDHGLRSSCGGRPPRLDALRRQLAERLPALPRYRCRLSVPHTGGLTWPSWEEDPPSAIEDHVRRGPPAGARGRARAARLGGRLLVVAPRPPPAAVGHRPAGGPRRAAAGRSPRRHTTPWSTSSGRSTSGTWCWTPGGDREEARLRRLRRARPSPPPAGERGHGTPAARAGCSSSPRRVVEESEGLVELLLRDEVIPAPAYEHQHADRDTPALRQRLRRAGRDQGHQGRPRRHPQRRGAGGPHRRSSGACCSPAATSCHSHGLRAMVPVNLHAKPRTPEAWQQGDLFFHLPRRRARPAEALPGHQGRSRGAEGQHQARRGAALIALTGLAPPVFTRRWPARLFASRLFNVTITNVPGPQSPLYGFGARPERVRRSCRSRPITRWASRW